MKALPLLAALVLGVAALPAHATPPAPLGNETSIPPNCLLNPWTGKLECVIWPTCTIDPWTGEMHCPVPRPTPTRMR
jgi:hypothetical protein